MRITASHSMKLPCPGVEYGSIGASVTIEGEPPPEVQGDRQKLATYTQALLKAAERLTEAHLAREGASAPESQDPRQNGQSRRPHRPMRDSNGRSNVNGYRANGNGRSNGSSEASPKQLNFLRSLANAEGMGYRGLADMAETMFGKEVLRLSKREASQLIEELKPEPRE